MVIRSAIPSDLDRITAIQRSTPLSARWNAADYLGNFCWVAEEEGIVEGYLAARQTVADEFEILDIAVAPQARKRGIATALLKRAREELAGRGYLEVRSSNVDAQRLYARCGWTVVGGRTRYYTNPDEDAVVMKI